MVRFSYESKLRDDKQLPGPGYYESYDSRRAVSVQRSRWGKEKRGILEESNNLNFNAPGPGYYESVGDFRKSATNFSFRDKKFADK